MTDASQWLRRILRYAAISGFALITLAVAWTLGPGAGWVLRHVDGVYGLKGKDLEDALDAVRGRALAVATGLAALLAVYYTARNADTARRTLRHSEESARRALEHSEKTAQRTTELTEQGQVTDRYTKAIEQLGSEKLDVRIGGIYALERIATDSARDHPTVMEVLAAFIREHAGPAPRARGDGAQRGPLAADVQAALTVIGRREVDNDTRFIDLAGTNLAGANLARAVLSNMRLTEVDLSAANLTRADLQGAELSYANLSHARLSDADLAEANLSDGDLSVADLTRVKLSGANLSDANLSGANLSGAYQNFRVSGGIAMRSYRIHGTLILRRANLTRANLSKAFLTDADMTGSNLTGANLAGTDLTGADLANAKLDEVVESPETKWPNSPARPDAQPN